MLSLPSPTLARAVFLTPPAPMMAPRLWLRETFLLAVRWLLLLPLGAGLLLTDDGVPVVSIYWMFLRASATMPVDAAYWSRGSEKGTGTIVWTTAVRDGDRLRLPVAQQLGSTGQHILSIRLDGAPVGDDVRLTFDSLRIEPDSGEPITVAVTYELELLAYPPN